MARRGEGVDGECLGWFDQDPTSGPQALTLAARLPSYPLDGGVAHALTPSQAPGARQWGNLCNAARAGPVAAAQRDSLPRRNKSSYKAPFRACPWPRAAALQMRTSSQRSAPCRAERNAVRGSGAALMSPVLWCASLPAHCSGSALSLKMLMGKPPPGVLPCSAAAQRAQQRTWRPVLQSHRTIARLSPGPARARRGAKSGMCGQQQAARRWVPCSPEEQPASPCRAARQPELAPLACCPQERACLAPAYPS